MLIIEILFAMIAILCMLLGGSCDSLQLMAAQSAADSHPGHFEVGVHDTYTAMAF